jgi:hypothetical protein
VANEPTVEIRSFDSVNDSVKPLKDIVKKEINTYFSTNCASGRDEQVDIVK